MVKSSAGAGVARGETTRLATGEVRAAGSAGESALKLSAGSGGSAERSRLAAGAARVTESVEESAVESGSEVGRVEESQFAAAEARVEELTLKKEMKGGVTMVRKARRASTRSFSGRDVRSARGVYNWRRASFAVIQAMLILVQCTNVVAEIPLAGRSSVHIRTELRSRLAASLAKGERAVAFAKECGFQHKPRADDPEAMINAFPGKDSIDWGADPVKSGLNTELWKFWHARHCPKCTQEQVHDQCYFKTLLHFLRCGFNMPVSKGCSACDAQPSKMAYVDKWREEEARCVKAFEKWKAESSGLMSEPVRERPKAVFPLLPVVRAKDAWRHSLNGVEYKVRLCMDFKNGGLNDMLDDWDFCYWGLESVAETVKKGDWLASIDISRFYLRLPAGRRLREMQWFQDPASYGVNTDANERMCDKRRAFRQLQSVAFGWKSAPAYASSVSAELKRILESFGVSVAGVYLDDFLIRGSTRQECLRNRDTAIRILTALGLPPNDKGQGPCAPEEGIVFLGVRIRTSDCSMTVTEEHRQYAVARLTSLLNKKSASLKELESVCGILSWIAQVFIPGRPRRDALYLAIHRAKAKAGAATPIRGHLKRQLEWWCHAMQSRAFKPSSHFWDEQPDIPLMCSDASGEDGWGACACGVHVVGNWPDEWKQSAGASAPSMLFKELVPIVIMILLLGSQCKGKVFAAATDNAGVAFVLNSMSCRCPYSLALLRPLADTLAKHHLGLLAGHAHREFNAHADELSHALSDTMWRNVCTQAQRRKTSRMEFQFVVHDTATNEAFAASMSFQLPISDVAGNAP